MVVSAKRDIAPQPAAIVLLFWGKLFFFYVTFTAKEMLQMWKTTFFITLFAAISDAFQQLPEYIGSLCFLLT